MNIILVVLLSAISALVAVVSLYLLVAVWQRLVLPPKFTHNQCNAHEAFMLQQKISQLEGKLEAYRVSQTETFARVLRLIEVQASNMKPREEEG